MDFFAQQDRARASTTRLVLLFFLAVALTNLAIYLALAGVFQFTHQINHLGARSYSRLGWFSKLAHHFGADGLWSWELFGWVTFFVTNVVGLVSLYKMRQLARGGGAVAELLGGRWVNPDTRDAEERQLLNVVEEMAIASGTPVPDVYLLDEESGINAFAAGHDSTDAAVGVTFGALKLLSRDELQGVIAHEFSHILNGDMRLNTRLIGWLHGVLGLVVLGRILTLSFLNRARTPDGERVGPVFHPIFLPAFVLGWICLAAGSCGAFCARLIKSAVSRQREFLADAAAVQFTRNPDGIVGALKKIGGVRSHAVLNAARSEEASHMYFGDGLRPRWFRFLATHPPLTDRIQRINPYFDGKFPAVSLERVLRESRVTELYREQGGKPVDFHKLAAVIGPGAAAQEMIFANAARENIRSAPSSPEPPTALESIPVIQLDFAMVLLGEIPAGLRAATCEPFQAVALIYALVCAKDADMRAQQLAALAERTEPGVIEAMARLQPEVAQLDPGHFLPLADLAVRSLRRLAPDQYENFQSNLTWLVEADAQIDLFEYMLQRMVVRHLAPHFGPVRKPPVQFYVLKPLRSDCAVLLSGLAWLGHEAESEARAAFQQGAALLSDDNETIFLPRRECNLPQMDAALDQLAQAAMPLKQQIMTALTAVAAADGQLQKREAELLRAMSDAVGLTVPPFLSGASRLAETPAE
jgi:Zn-dependent protease with chaperone function